MNTAIIIVGATAAGKTAAAIRLADKINGEIISADSRQIYKFLNIGTNKPEKKQLKKPAHHIIDIIEPTENFSAGKFAKQAEITIREILKRGHVPIITGGTGLYVKSLTDGLIEVPLKPEIRKKLLVYANKYGRGYLLKRLARLDPETAADIDKSNTARVMRALEICLSTGRKFSDIKKEAKKTSPYNFLSFGLDLPREELYKRINTRTDYMIKNGLVAETKKLVKKYSSNNAVLASTIGYKEIIDYLDGKHTLEKAADMIKQNTRHYAKRQLTWFKKDKNIIWVDARENAVENILKYIKKSCIIGNCDKKKSNFSRR